MPSVFHNSLRWKLVWSPAAVDDLNAAVDYVESELASPMTARRLIDSVIARAQLSADVPGAGQLGGGEAAAGLGVSVRWRIRPFA